MYDRQKIKKALMLSFAKRNINTEQLEWIITNLEIQWSSDRNEVSSSEIWDDILHVLKEMDAVAYVRFASVYKSFHDLKDFSNILEEVK
jgi:transcriptional repressor NrdR